MKCVCVLVENRIILLREGAASWNSILLLADLIMIMHIDIFSYMSMLQSCC